MKDQGQGSTNTIGILWNPIWLELKEALELFRSQSPKLVNTIRLRLADRLFRLPSLAAADVGYQHIIVGGVHRKCVGAFLFFNWKIWHPGSVAIRSPLPFAHTARRYYRLDGLVRPSDPPRRVGPRPWRSAEKTVELDYLQEVKVVTKFP